MNRYENGKIYKLIDNTNGNIYIGTTCLPSLAKRLAQHRSYYNGYIKGYEQHRYVTSFKILENNDYSIVLIEEYPCQTKDQLLARERHHIETNQCVNKKIPTRTQKEYYQHNKEKIAEHNKKYKEQNKERYKEQSLKYRSIKFECECGGKYKQHHKAVHCRTLKHQKFLNSIVEENGIEENIKEKIEVEENI